MRRIAVMSVVLLAAGSAASAEPASPAAALKTKRSHQRSVRSAGYLLIGGGVALGAATGAAVALGARARDSIRFGGFDTAEDIEDRAVQARRYDTAAWCFAGAGAALAVTGFALVLTHPDPRAPRIEASPVEGGAIVGVSGVLP